MTPELTWYRLPGEPDAHAFVAGPGWMRSACQTVRWTAALLPADPARRHCCPDCLAAIEARRPLEPVMDEAEARLVFGR